ncbi:MAG: DUF883 family protein [Thiohalobacteraceae bacterium]|nr:DUF883 family protein [Gammaproteobacteria bacterium]
MERSSEDVTREQLIADFKAVVADAEALLKATVNQGGQEVAEVRAKVQESIQAAKARMVEEQAALLARTREAARATDDYVREHPWGAIGIAAGVGLLLGLLSGGRR